MSDFKLKIPWFVDLVVVIGIVAGLVAVLYSAVQQCRNPKGPHGAMIPAEPPNEANRIRHATGLSIIAPENWDQTIDRGPDFPELSIAPRGIPGTRLKALIIVQEMDAPGEDVLRGCSRLTFQGFKAHETMRIERTNTFDDPAWSSYHLYVNRDGEWWHIMFGLADETRVLPPEIRQFLNTIELPPARQ